MATKSNSEDNKHVVIDIESETKAATIDDEYELSRSSFELVQVSGNVNVVDYSREEHFI